MTILLKLFSTFFVIGIFSFGGGYAVMSLLKESMTQQGWLTVSQFTDMIAIAQSTPGPIAINLATYIGFQQAGFLGGIFTSFAVLLPGATTMLLIARYFHHFYEKPATKIVFKCLRPAVIGLIGSAAYSVAEVTIFRDEQIKIEAINWQVIALTIICCLLIGKYKLHPIPLITGSALVGIFLL